ncbi:MAG: 4'-phosphopantetheinyl transferase superfamily protein [Bacteroidales bacterium]|nr:4'-phosphopantetheinyl transferase superfamily protein [Bacteroidales bacterium]
MLFKKFSDKSATMGIWQMTETLAELEAMYTVTDDERPVYDGFRNDRRRKEWLTVRILLHELLGKDVEICYRDTGKPYLKDSSYCISITHTIGYVGIRLAAHPVALDMEYKADRVLRIIDRFVNEKEMKYIDERDKVSSALVLWSAKETLFKLFDFQEVDFKEHLFISRMIWGNSGHFRGTVNKDGFRADVKLGYKVFGDLILVYC